MDRRFVARALAVVAAVTGTWVLLLIVTQKQGLAGTGNLILAGLLWPVAGAACIAAWIIHPRRSN